MLALTLAQVLSGASGAAFGVMMTLVAADITRGTGRFNLTLGLLGVAVSVGASLSTSLAGVLATTFNDRSAFVGLALAVRELDDDTRVRVHSDGPAADHAVMAAVERHMTLLGTVSMIDPVRDQVPDAMAAARGAHINVNILTGDAATTASAIATRAGLGEPAELTTISADDFDAMSDDEIVRHALSGSTVFARVAPEDKMRIVDLVKKSGNVVAVTGDGVNDAPALKHADIGVAMGRSGTDVAKQSAEMILLDDSFATLVRAVSLGRTVYANITKGVLSCLTSNAAELVVNDRGVLAKMLAMSGE